MCPTQAVCSFQHWSCPRPFCGLLWSCTRIPPTTHIGPRSGRQGNSFSIPSEGTVVWSAFSFRHLGRWGWSLSPISFSSLGTSCSLRRRECYDQQVYYWACTSIGCVGLRPGPVTGCYRANAHVSRRASSELGSSYIAGRCNSNCHERNRTENRTPIPEFFLPFPNSSMISSVFPLISSPDTRDRNKLVHK